jgi:hypothetical protein
MAEAITLLNDKNRRRKEFPLPYTNIATMKSDTDLNDLTHNLTELYMQQTLLTHLYATPICSKNFTADNITLEV